MTRSLWNIQSLFYHLLRRNPLSVCILRRESQGIHLFLRDLSPQSVLDIGCGRGNSLRLLWQFTAFITAVDQVLRMVRKTKQRFPAIKYVVSEVPYLPFTANSFDLISCIGVVEYIKNHSTLLQEIHRVLSPEGYAVITISPPGPLTYLRLFLGHRLYTLTEEGFRRILAVSVPLSIINSNRTLLQHQFLLKKKM